MRADAPVPDRLGSRPTVVGALDRDRHGRRPRRCTPTRSTPVPEGITPDDTGSEHTGAAERGAAPSTWGFRRNVVPRAHSRPMRRHVRLVSPEACTERAATANGHRSPSPRRRLTEKTRPSRGRVVSLSKESIMRMTGSGQQGHHPGGLVTPAAGSGSWCTRRSAAVSWYHQWRPTPSVAVPRRSPASWLGDGFTTPTGTCWRACSMG